MIARSLRPIVRAALVAGAVSAAQLLAGCPPCGGGGGGGRGGGAETHLRAWQFESDCNDDTCGWTAPQGTARRVSTFHPGEHGLAVPAGTTLAFDLSQERVELFTGEQYFRYVARCDAGATVRVRATVAPGEPTDAGREAGRPLTVERVDQPGEQWTPAGGALPGASRGFARGLALTVEGRGACTLDRLDYGELVFFGFCE